MLPEKTDAPKALQVGVLQLPARWNARETALAEADQLLSQRPVELVVFPECALTGYVSENLSFDVRPFAETVEGPTARALSELARRHHVALAGPLIEQENSSYFNSTLLFDQEGRLVTVYRKRHPWYPETWATAGKQATPVVPLRFGEDSFSIAIGVCFDGHFLAKESRKELSSADMLIFPSAWVERGRDTRPGLLGGLAKMFSVSVLNANWGPGNPRIWGQGRSAVYDHNGTLLARAGEETSAVLLRAAVFRAESKRRPHVDSR